MQARGISKHVYPYVMPPERTSDIDTPWQFHLAELILKDREERS